jgi:caffeoyl-CoA O-methyltransferase
MIDERVSDYADAHTTPMPAYMRQLAEETQATQDSPAMLTSPAAGRLLELLVWTTGAKRILEIGTYTGHSALAMAAALPEDGRIITLELDPARAAFARSHMDASPYGDRIEIRVGPALDSVRSLDGPFDLVFIDADKMGYPDYFDATLPLLSERGLIVLDNTLQAGRVLDEDPSEQTQMMNRLNARLASDDRLITVLLSVRDGMTVVRRA